MHPDPLERPAGPDSFERLAAVDRICGRFEADRVAGLATTIEELIADAPRGTRATLLGELLLVEWELLDLRTGSPEILAYRDRFSADRDIVDEALRRRPGEPPPADPTQAAAERARFRIVHLQAQGGTGELYLARDDQLDRDVALKQLRAAFADDDSHRMRIEAEAKVIAALEHPGIVPIYAASHRSNGDPYFVMRMVRGRSLKEEINAFHARGPWSEPARARRLAIAPLIERLVDVSNTVAYAHSRGVIHRDIKPSNIMIGDYGEAIVIDWGLAKRLGDAGPEDPSHAGPAAETSPGGPSATLAGAVLGTPGYLSPEQASGEEVGPASDLYGLGATLYHVLTGRPAFDAARPVSEMLADVRDGRFPAPRQVVAAIPAGLDAICRKAMSRRPADRYPSALDLVADLERWLADEPVLALPDGPIGHAGRWLRRHRFAAAAGVIALFAATVLATAAMQRSFDERRIVRERVDSLRSAAYDAVPAIVDRLRDDPARAASALAAALEEADQPGERTRLALALLDSEPERGSALAAEALGAEPAALRVIRDRLVEVGAIGGAADGLWRVLDDEGAEPGRRFRAACMLASTASDDPRWAGLGRFLVARFDREVRREPGAYAIFRDLLRPVRRPLLPDLIRAFRPTMYAPPHEATRKLALALLTDDFADDPEVLAAILPDVGEGELAALIETIARSPGRAVPVLAAVATAAPATWPERDEPRGFDAPDEVAARAIDEASGRLTDRFAFCQAMPLGRFREIAERLRPSGYRPIRARPYRARDAAVHVAAVWARDARPWTIADVAADRLGPDVPGMIAQDVAGYLGGPEGDSPRFLVVRGGLETADPRLLAALRRVPPVPREEWLRWPVELGSPRVLIGERIEPARDEHLATRQAFRGVDGALIWCAIAAGIDPGFEPLAPFVGDATAFLDRSAHGGAIQDLAIAGDGPGSSTCSIVWTPACWLNSTVVHAADLASRALRRDGRAGVPAGRDRDDPPGPGRDDRLGVGLAAAGIGPVSRRSARPTRRPGGGHPPPFRGR
jgi:tRNA A-37 threonylcarbamoyl transferase component Bud32